MAQPPAYEPSYDFSDFQSSNPTAPLPANQIDSQFNAIKTTTDGIRDNLALIQRDDGLLANQSVHKDAFTSAALALMAGSWTPQGTWTTATAYAVSDVVEQGDVTYVCVTAHTAGTFSTDEAAGYWMPFAVSGEAVNISQDNTTNELTAETVQAALDELAAEVNGYLSKSVAGSADVTLTASEAQIGYIVLTGALTGNINLVVPTKASGFFISNATSGAYTLTVKTAAGSGIAVTQGRKAVLWCDGTDVVEFMASSGGTLQTLGDVSMSGLASGDFVRYDGSNFVNHDVAAIKTALGVNAATDSVSGVVELATSAEAIAGASATLVVTPATLHGALKGVGSITPATGDAIILRDASDSNAVKAATVSDILALVDSTGWVPVSVATPSGASSIEFTGMTDYDQYQVVYTVTAMSSAADLNLKMSVDNGSTYTAGTGDYQYGATGVDRTNASAGYAGSNQNQIVFLKDAGTANGDILGSVTLTNPRSATDNKAVQFWSAGGVPAGSNYYAGKFGWGLHVGGTISGADVDAIEITPSTGTVSGTFWLLGRNLT